jgi:hypothetical protein
MKGLFTQGVAVLFAAPPSVDSLAELLPEPSARKPAASEWAMGGPTLVLPLDLEVNGLWAVDVVDRPWPDDMGHPQESPMLFASWTMGHFGPYAFPNGLERACGQSRLSPGAPAAAKRHTAFVRLRSSYIFGAKPEAKVAPPNYDPVAELTQLTGLVGRLLRHPDALCYFNPNGEVLCEPQAFAETAAFNAERQRPHLDLWTNVRMWNAGGGVFVMDSLGLGQLDRVDHEVIFRPAHVEPGEIAAFVRNLSFYSMSQRPVFDNGHTVDGPGGVWRVTVSDKSAVSPPRPVLRWARDGETLPETLGS